MGTQTLIDIAYYVAVMVAFLVSFAISVVQRAKQKNITKLQALYECIPNAVINAENLFGKGNGDKKKLFVMTELINIALQSKTKYDYNELDKHVESVVKATKNVNVTAVESVEDTFCEECDSTQQSVNNDVNNVAVVETDGAVVVEIDKIKDGDENGSDN